MTYTAMLNEVRLFEMIEILEEIVLGIYSRGVLCTWINNADESVIRIDSKVTSKVTYPGTCVRIHY